MPMRCEREGGALTFYVSGEVDHHGAKGLLQGIDGQLEESFVKTVVVDLSGVSFMDSSGIGLIMGRYKLMNGRGGIVRVIGLKKRDRRIVEMSGLKKLIEIG